MGAITLAVTFVGNMAVHVSDGRTSVLTDFPYESGAFGCMEWRKSLVPEGPRPPLSPFRRSP